MRRRDDDEDVYGRRIISVDLPSPSTKEAGRVARNSSRPLSVRPLRLPQSKSTTSLLLLLIAAILTALSLRSGNGISSIGVQAETCSPNGIQNVTVSDDMASNNLSDVFACDDGEFNVSWVGVVYVSKTIKIGPGTIVRIFGETAMVTTGTESSSDPVSSSLKSRNSEKNSSDIDLEFELERLSNGLNLPQGLTSAAVASVGLGGGDSSSDFFGPIFFVEQGELHLDSLAVRRGNSSNSSSNVIVSGGGILAINSNVSVSGCVFEENFAQILGGGIHANLSTLVVKDSVFHRNHAGLQSFAGDEDAGSAGGGIACVNSNLYLDGCLFNDNYANVKGGGVHTGTGRVSVVNSLFFNNLAGSNNVYGEDALGEGAAFSFSDCTGSFNNQSSCGVNDTIFIFNTAAKKAGAIALTSYGSSYIEFYRCLIDNSTTGWPFEDDPQGEGGALSLGAGTTLVLEDCVVRKNYCGNKGGTVTLSSGTGWDDPGATVIMRNSSLTENAAGRESAGVIYLGEYATARIEGQGNNFTGNVCGTSGGVLSATTHTNVTVEGGLFQGNEADEGGGVFQVNGILTISGGTFSQNSASSGNGGVVYASGDSSVTLSDGRFEGNDALNGGVVFIAEDAELFVRGGLYSGNSARNGGGVFWGEDVGDLEITGGTFTSNTAYFGGFLYAIGEGKTTCEGASVVEHNGVEGGAIYAAEGAMVDCRCHLIGNKALSGPAIQARENAQVTVHDVHVSDNVVTRGGVVHVLSSILYTYRVNFSDSTQTSDLSAVQTDSDSIYIAEETTFVGFEGQTVIFSEGILYLDDCDFSESSTSALVFTGNEKTTVIRNAVLGDKNFEAVIKEASAASDLPVNASLINVALSCSRSGWPCSVGSPCLKGDLGVYCQCYERNLSSSKPPAQMCLDGDLGGLSLTEMMAPPVTFFPNLLERDLSLSHDSIYSSEAPFTSTSSQTAYISSNSAPSTSTSLLTSGGVIWSVVAIKTHKFVSWTVFPSVGLLLPGKK